MSAEYQTIAALLVVAAVVTWFVARAVARRRKPGCSSDCGCAGSDLKTKLKR
jgi:hypothetical protein